MRSLWIVLWIAVACHMAGCSRQEAGWRDAAGEDTVTAYEEYLLDYPAGAHAAEARARMLELRDQEAWAKASRLRTPEAWQRYLGDWPDGAHAIAARRNLAAFVAGAAPAVHGAYSVQLGAYSTEAAAHADLARHARAHAEDLAGVELRILAAQDIGGDMWRLRTKPLAEAAARDLCARLRARGVDCLPLAD